MKYSLIESNSEILGGKPCIKGSRISVQLILEWLGTGATIDDIIRKYPHLTIEGVQQSILYAAEAMKNEILIEVSHSKAA